VESGENVAIGGFIITGTAPKKVMIRGIGPSLQAARVANPLSDPVLELKSSNTALLARNDNWKDLQQSEIEQSNLAPNDPLEASIIATLDPGSYTAVLTGNKGESGVGLIEIYDLDQAPNSSLANMSTRGLVGPDQGAMIGGVILGDGENSGRMLVRALGPSLASFGITTPLPDPVLELHDANVNMLQTYHKWTYTQKSEFHATGLAPADEREAALLVDLSPGMYTAVVVAKNGSNGVGLLEIYHLP
jgi:hypothetical protein